MSAPEASPPADVRPGIWVGHVSIAADDVAASSRFYVGLGMRHVHSTDDVSVLELAGGTHLVILGRDATDGVGLAPSVDLMVDDVDAAREAWLAHDPTEIVRGPVHRTFEMHDPAGNHVAVHDSHVVGAV